MYEAKAIGRGMFEFYSAQMNLPAQQRLDTETRLRQAVREQESVLFYQPRLEAATRRFVAVEALIRRISPTHGIVPPVEFISVLEDTGMIIVVGERALIETNAPAELIELELTEPVLIRNTDQARETINALKSLGVGVAIDDFGTGYSSLNYLRQFDVDYLKIDRSFATELESNSRSRTVATAIINLVAALGITVAAEGVETEAQAQFFPTSKWGVTGLLVLQTAANR